MSPREPYLATIGFILINGHKDLVDTLAVIHPFLRISNIHNTHPLSYDVYDFTLCADIPIIETSNTS